MEKNEKKLIIIAGVIALILVIAIVAIIVIINNFSENSNTSMENMEVLDVAVQLDETDIQGSNQEVTSTIVLKDNATDVDGGGVTLSGNTVYITNAGTYYISGTLTDGSIIINTTKDSQVNLILSNVSITSSTTSAISCTKASKLVITLEENTTNYLEDASTYKYASADETEPDAALFTKSDLTINGTGTLEIKANYADGIVSKDTLKLVSGNIIIDAKDDGIRGKDSVEIAEDVELDITCNGDGIKSTNTEDTSLGYVVIEGANIKIIAQNDGIQAETVLSVKNATLNITTGGGSSVSSSSSSSNWGSWGGSTSTTTDTASSKGLKATTQIDIEGGNITINSSDDSIHSNSNIIITSGTITVNSGDDGIHADTNLQINGGNITVEKSYEGLEATTIEINNGTIEVNASDDGINAAGGNDSSSTNGRMGQNSFSGSTGKIYINGGNIVVNAQGDGIDANGSIYITGGTTIVNGPTNSGNGALDYDSECKVTGGTFVTLGSSGMLQGPSSSSTQCSITFTQTGSSGDSIVLKDSSGNEIISIKATKQYGAITISTPDMKQGETYSVVINGTTVKTISQSSVTVSSGSAGMGGMQGGQRR